jgi:hypothetical protein
MAQIHAANDRRFENTFRVFESKYSNLIDIREQEQPPIAAIARVCL